MKLIPLTLKIFYTFIFKSWCGQTIDLSTFHWGVSLQTIKEHSVKKLQFLVWIINTIDYIHRNVLYIFYKTDFVVIPLVSVVLVTWLKTSDSCIFTNVWCTVVTNQWTKENVGVYDSIWTVSVR